MDFSSLSSLYSVLTLLVQPSDASFIGFGFTEVVVVYYRRLLSGPGFSLQIEAIVQHYTVVGIRYRKSVLRFKAKGFRAFYLTFYASSLDLGPKTLRTIKHSASTRTVQ